MTSPVLCHLWSLRWARNAQSGVVGPNVVGGFVCLSVWLNVCNNDNFRKPWCRKLIFGLLKYLYGIRVKFVYEGHQVKVKVIVEKKRNSLFPQCRTSIGNRPNSGSVEDTVEDTVCVQHGFFAMADRIVWSPSLSRDQKYTNSRVVCLRWEGSLVGLIMPYGLCTLATLRDA